MTTNPSIVSKRLAEVFREYDRRYCNREVEGDYLEGAARALDDAGVREVVEKSTIGSRGHECPFCKAALSALTGTQEVNDG